MLSCGLLARLLRFVAPFNKFDFLRRQAIERIHQLIDLPLKFRRVCLWIRAFGHENSSEPHRPGLYPWFVVIEENGWSPVAKIALDDFDIDHDAEDNFTSHAELRRLIPKDPGASVSHVKFDAGSITKWHHHHGVQLLWFMAGEGLVQSRKGATVDQPLTCQAGDMVRVAPNTSHRHGATSEHAVEHIALTVGTTFWE